MRTTCSLILLAAVMMMSSTEVAGAESYDPPLAKQVVNEVHSVGPRLLHVKNFASDFEMDHIIKQSFQQMRPQMQNTETGVVHELPVNGDPILEAIEERLKSVVPGVGKEREDKFSGDGAETLRVRRYLPDGVGYKGGDYHPPHTDWYERPGMGKDDALLVTLMIYMTSPEEGGQTHFESANDGKGYNFQPVRGDLAVWWSCTKDGKQDMKSMHEAIPVKKGIKWNATRFLYDNVKVCSSEAAKEIMVPKVAFDNVPSTDSMKTMFGTTMPNGVTTGPMGTADSDAEPEDFGDDADFEDEDTPLDEEDSAWHAAFMDTLSHDELKELAELGMSPALNEKMTKFIQKNAGKDEF